MDVRMPDLDGISATRELSAAFPEVKLVILTTFEQDECIFGALSAGASGLLLKRTRPEELIAAIHTIGGRRLAAVPRGHEPRDRTHGRAAPPRRVARRAPRRAHTGEREVLELVARGLSNGELAAELAIEESTARTHLKRVLAKLGVRDRVQALIFAYESGLTQPGSGSRPYS